MWAHSVWSLFALAVGFWLAMIGLSQDWIRLQPWFFSAGLLCVIGSGAALCWPLREQERRAIVRQKCRRREMS